MSTLGIFSDIQNIIKQNVGLRADTASVTGSLSSKISYAIYLGYGVIASDTAKVTNTATVTTTSSSYVKGKETLINRSGSARIKWKQYPSGGVSGVESRVYINGVAYGVVKTFSAGQVNTWVDLSDDIVCRAGDFIQIWFKGAGFTTEIKDMTICFDVVDDTADGIGIL